LAPRRTVVLVAALAAVLLAGCRADTTVTLRVDRSGAGSVRAVVRLDRAAVVALQAGHPRVEDAVRLDDLRRAGWSARWRTVGDPPSSATLTLEKPFATPDGAASVVEELAGPDGPLREVRVARDAGAFTTRTSLSAVADLGGLSSGVASDAELSRRLSAAGIDPVELDRRMSEGLGSAARLKVRVELPGAAPRTFSVGPGGRARVGAEASSLEARRVAAWATAGVLALGALALGVGGEVAARRRRRARGADPSP